MFQQSQSLMEKVDFAFFLFHHFLCSIIKRKTSERHQAIITLEGREPKEKSKKLFQATDLEIISRPIYRKLAWWKIFFMFTKPIGWKNADGVKMFDEWIGRERERYVFLCIALPYVNVYFKRINDIWFCITWHFCISSWLWRFYRGKVKTKKRRTGRV